MNPSSLFGRLLDAGADDLVVRATDGDSWSMPIGRWLAAASDVDERVLDRATGPVLDVGCGPGRHVHALSRRGVAAIGVELSPTAVRHARNRGARVVEGSIFEVAPDPGVWATALLLDGNIGIGGRPDVLLRRVGELLRAGGTILVELDPTEEPPVRPAATASGADGGPSDAPRSDAAGVGSSPGGPVRIRIESDGTTSAWFPWARVTADAIEAPARAAGMVVTERWSDGDRHFCTLTSS
jgi:SAM-dependent methyltransferase